MRLKKCLQTDFELVKERNLTWRNGKCFGLRPRSLWVQSPVTLLRFTFRVLHLGKIWTLLFLSYRLDTVIAVLQTDFELVNERNLSWRNGQCAGLRPRSEQVQSPVTLLRFIFRLLLPLGKIWTLLSLSYRLDTVMAVLLVQERI